MFFLFKCYLCVDGRVLGCDVIGLRDIFVGLVIVLEVGRGG